MAKFWFEADKNAEATQRRWIREYGQTHVPTTKTIKYHVDYFLADGGPTTGFENRHIYVPKVTKIIDTALIF